MTVTTQDKLNNPELILKELEFYPHTYKTILKNEWTATFNFILRRKLCNMFKHGEVLKCIIPGTRRGEVIFFPSTKKYKIMVKNERIGVSVFYFYGYKQVNDFYISVPECYKLKGCDWHLQQAPMTFFTGDILKFF
jgi:hypothetical protein